MNTQNFETVWQRSTTRRFFRWIFSWRVIRPLLLVAAWTATVIALFYAVENWRGYRSWQKYRAEAAARGVQLDYRAFIPQAVPDEQNFAATPFVRSWFETGKKSEEIWNDTFIAVERSISNTKFQKDRGRRYFRDLAARKQAIEAVKSGRSVPRNFETGKLDRATRAEAAPAILEELKANDAIFSELRSASRRPEARYPVVYSLENPWGILLPHLYNTKEAVQRLVLKASAELALGQSGAALEDVRLMLYLGDTLRGEPFLISHLVRNACVQIAATAVWEGLAENRWSEVQLVELQKFFQNYDFVADSQKPLGAERAVGVLTVDLLLKRKFRLGHLDSDLPVPYSLENLGVSNMEFGAIIARVVPRGWYHQEQLNYCRAFEERLERRFDRAKKRIHPNRLEISEEDVQPVISGAGGKRTGRDAVRDLIRHRFVATLLLRDLGEVPERFAVAQVTADQVALGCALERYRSVHGEYPGKLAALVPSFIAALPHDVLTGEPYLYKRDDRGDFVLYSVGWNGSDDGGVPGRRLFDDLEGDWVWEYE